MASQASHKSSYALAISYIVQELIASYEDGATLNLTKLKGDASKKYKLQGIPKMCDILQGLPVQYRSKLWPYLQTKPVRTASGVAVVAVMSKPHRCPHIAIRAMCVCTVPVDPTRTLNIRLRPTRDTNQRVCERFGHDTIPIRKCVGVCSNCERLDIQSTKWSSSSWEERF